MAKNKISIENAGEYSVRRRTWRAVLVQAVLLMGMWLLLSGHYDVFHISLGVFSVILVHLFNAKINRIQFFERDVPEWEKIRYDRLLRYIPWLVWQIVVSALQVAYVVLMPRMPIKPSLLRFKAKLPNVGASVILGNSITLTPGTITIEIDHDTFLVHSLIDESSGGLIDGTMPREVAKLFQRSPGDVVSDVQIITSARDL